MPVEPDRTAVGGDVRIGWVGGEDSGPSVTVWYRRLDMDQLPGGRLFGSAGPVAWAVLRFPLAMYVRYHSDRLWLDSLSSPMGDHEVHVPGSPVEARALMRSTTSDLRAELLDSLSECDTAHVGRSWFGLEPMHIHHYRLSSPDDGYFDVVSAEVEIGEVMCDREGAGLWPVPNVVASHAGNGR